MIDLIDDGEERHCTNCGGTKFGQGYQKLITCNNCYERYNPIPHANLLFLELTK